MLVCMGVGSIFASGGHWLIFANVFLGGSKVEKFFYHSKLGKKPFLLKFSNSFPTSNTKVATSQNKNLGRQKNVGVQNVSF